MGVNWAYMHLFAEKIKKNTFSGHNSHIQMQFSLKQTTVHFCSQLNMMICILLNMRILGTLIEKEL